MLNKNCKKVCRNILLRHGWLAFNSNSSKYPTWNTCFIHFFLYEMSIAWVMSNN